MATALILFAFWDVMAGVFAYDMPRSEKVIWTSADEASVSNQFKALKKYHQELRQEIRKGTGSDNTCFERILILKPKLGEVNAPKALQKFLEFHNRRHRLGVDVNYFAHTVRPKYRNKLAHMYSTPLNTGAGSFSVSRTDFKKVIQKITQHSEQVVGKKIEDDGSITEYIDVIAMLRDTDNLARGLLEQITTQFSEESCDLALRWLQGTNESSAVLPE